MRYGHRHLVNPPTTNGSESRTDEVLRLAARTQHAILVRLAEAAANGKVEEALAQADRLRDVHELIARHNTHVERDRQAREEAGVRIETIDLGPVTVG